LVPEVRIEVATFYGDLNSAEARYPGLNYCHPPHRMRLGRFKHHRRLFQAFDDLGLTYNEIQEFCCWEGTKWARERYERDEGVKVVDTTGDEIGPFVDRRELRREEMGRRGSITRKTDIEVVVEDRQRIEEGDEDMSDADSEGGEEDENEAETTADESPQEAAALEEHISELSRRRQLSINSREQEYNRRIMAAWEQGLALTPELENYLKEQSERGTLPMSMDLRNILRRSASGYQPLTNPSNATSPTTVASRAAA
jgi:DNA-binding transcriptional MerR regulator